ncbi:hypothetical protein EDD15DRAFT_2467770 [Pisolithus albus]|nr:hypothetical protein EDD15DRAFT_2467770 [Pisolithus albus]
MTKDWIITNYAVLTSLEYIVWFLDLSILRLLSADELWQVTPSIASGEFARGWRSSVASDYILWVDPHNPFAASYFAHKIYHLCRPQVGWVVTAPITLFLLTHFAFGVAVVILTFANDEFSFLPKIKFSALIPCSAALVLVEVLITLSLCILLYDNGSHSAFPRTKCLLNTLIIYAEFHVRLVALAELAALVDNQDMWAVGLDFNIGKLYVNSFLASLNTRHYLRSRVSGLKPDLAINDPVHVEHFAKLPGDEETVNGGKMHREGHEASVIDTTAVRALDKMTRL